MSSDSDKEPVTKLLSLMFPMRDSADEQTITPVNRALKIGMISSPNTTTPAQLTHQKLVVLEDAVGANAEPSVHQGVVDILIKNVPKKAMHERIINNAMIIAYKEKLSRR